VIATLRVGLMFGGRSVEHEISVISARGVAGALVDAGLEVVPIGVTGEGRWLSPERSRDVLAGGEKRAEAGADDDGSGLAVDPGAGRIVMLAPGAEPRPIAVDVVFPLLHGWGGEDGRLQGLLDLARIPYVGAGVAGSAVAMDKVAAKKIFGAHDLPVPRWLSVRQDDYAAAKEAAHARVVREIGFPAFVKPVNGGSSVGVSRVTTADGLVAAFAESFACDHHTLVEEGIDAREIECAVLGNDEPQASGLGEIVPSGEFYDYAAKYLDGTSELIIPAKLDVETTETVRRHAVTAFRALGLAGLARVDFLVERESGRIYLNEVNTLPGFTPISMFPRLWQASGLPFAELVRRLVDLAEERAAAEGELRTRWREDGTN
jgi:D-alanine-D-alanine ligase